MRSSLLPVVLLVLASACRAAPCRNDAASEEVEVNAVVDAWHAAASRADEEAYFGALAPDAVFLGTDASERWTVEEFRAYAHPHFAAGRGWTYLPRDRHVAFSADGHSAWVDERLDNTKYGELRGTGVLVLTAAGWRIAHYSMSFPIPNDLTLDVVERIRAGTPDAASKEEGGAR
jgi:hypothetical protein